MATDITGASARAMLESLINGIDDPKVLAKLAKGRMKSKRDQLVKALRRLMDKHQKMMLSAQLRHIDFLNQEIARLDKEIKERMRPFEHKLKLLDTIPGVGWRTD